MPKVAVTNELQSERTDYSQPARFTRKEFCNFRNHVVRTLGGFGSAGPSGEADLTGDDQGGPRFARGTRNPDFFVVDDMYNEHDQLSIVECNVGLVNAELIGAMVEMAANFPGWRVVMNMGDCGLRISGDRVWIGGRRFWDCSTVEEIGARCQRPIDYGDPKPADSMYGFWRDVLCGEFRKAECYPVSPNREWREAVAIIEQLRRDRAGRAISASAYERIRHDLHPQTRREFLERLLGEASQLPRDHFRAAQRNLRRGAAEALASNLGDDDQRRIVRLVSRVQVEGLLAAKETVFWWPYIIDEIKEPSATLRLALNQEFGEQRTSSSPWIQLSAVFGLAKLRAEGIQQIVHEAINRNPEWQANDELVRWLRALRAGSVGYPSELKLD